MNLLQGILLHELILIILGFILGLVLIFIFLYTAIKSKPNINLLFGFIVPLVMIGYPSFKSNQFGNEVVKVDTLVQKVNEDPTNVTAQKALVEELRKLPASRCTTSVDAMTTIAAAQASMGFYDSAKVTIKKAVELDKSSPKALQTQKDITDKWETREELKKQIVQIDNSVKRIEKNPQNMPLRDTLVMQLKEFERINGDKVVHLENQDVLSVATAVAVAGRPVQAVQIANEVLRIDPKQKEATNLKKDLQKPVLDKKYQTPTKSRLPNKTQAPRVNEASRATIPAPVPVFSDTAMQLRLRVTPKSEIPFKKWDSKN